MENKKKFRFGFVILLLLLFTMSLGLFSTSYAEDLSFKNLIAADYSAIFNYMADNVTFWNLPQVNNSKLSSFFRTVSQDSSKMSSLAQQISEYGSNFGTVYQVVFALTERYGTVTIYIYANNNQIGDSYPFLKVWQASGSPPYNRLQYITDSGSSTTYNYITINVDYNNNSLTVNSPTPSDAYTSTFVYETASNIDIGNGVYFANFPCVFGLRQKNIAQYTNYNPTIYSQYIDESSAVWRELANSVELVSMVYVEPTPEPEEPSGENSSTGTITDNNGETTGKIDLSGIENGITNIQNQISGDTQKVINNQNQNTQTIVNSLSGEAAKITNTLTDSADDLIDNTTITSGDIESALNFKTAQDPYSNFWLTLTNNLKTALLGTKRSIDISFQGRTWIISLDEYMVLPAWLIIILTPFSTAFFTWVLVRQFKLIFNKLASGNVDSLLKENSEERHFQFVLGGE